MWRLVFALSLPLAAFNFAHADPVAANPGAAYTREAPATCPAETAKPVDPQKAATTEVVVRGTLAPNAAGPGRGGWPTYTLTVSEVFKTPQDVKIEIGQKLTVKTVKEFKGAVTLYLVFDQDQKLYRLQDPLGKRGFSHESK
jgi:hypothetical protein